MAQQEKYWTRDLTYSQWHRPDSIGRYLGMERAVLVTMIDGDAIEYDDGSKQPLAIFETAKDIGQFKPTTVTRNMGRSAGIRAYATLYTPANELNPAAPLERQIHDIASFRVRRLTPSQTDFRVMTPHEYAEFLWKIHDV